MIDLNWRLISELIVGDELLDVNGNILLVENFAIELTEKPVTVYNFQVEDFHTYHVCTLGVLVHNASDYSNLKDSKYVGEGKKFTKAQKKTDNTRKYETKWRKNKI